MNAHKIAGDLEGGAWAIGGVLTGMLVNFDQQRRQRRAQSEADAQHISASGHAAASRAWCENSNQNLRARIVAEAQIGALEDQVDDLTNDLAKVTRQRAELLTYATELRLEVEALRAQVARQTPDVKTAAKPVACRRLFSVAA